MLTGAGQRLLIPLRTNMVDDSSCIGGVWLSRLFVVSVAIVQSVSRRRLNRCWWKSRMLYE